MPKQGPDFTNALRPVIVLAGWPLTLTVSFVMVATLASSMAASILCSVETTSVHDVSKVGGPSSFLQHPLTRRYVS